MSKDQDIFPLWASEDDPKVAIGYMCLTDFECEIGAASGGSRVFPSVEDVRRTLACADSCGVVEVEVRATRIVLPRTEDF